MSGGGGGNGRGGEQLRQVSNQYQFYPSLSGSETDVSTSTENLTQVRNFSVPNIAK